MGVLANRVRVNTATTGTGTISLGSAVAGYQTFADGGVADAAVVSYVIVDVGNVWEVGEGTFALGASTMTRSVTESSDAGAALSLSGAAQVFISLRAEDVVATPTQDQTTWNTGTDTTESLISAAKLDAKLDSYEQQIGVGQIPQDVLGSRSNNTSYQNTEAKPISVSVSQQNVAGVNAIDLLWSADGVTFIETMRSMSSSGARGCVFGIIPAGSYYKIVATQTIITWVELR